MENASKAESPYEIVLVAENENKNIIGYTWLRWKNNTSTVSTFGICISRPYQGLGLAKKIIIKLLKISKQIAPSTIHLTVQKANKKALKLYLSMGFQIIKEQMREANPQYGFEAEAEYLMEYKLH